MGQLIEAGGFLACRHRLPYLAATCSWFATTGRTFVGMRRLGPFGEDEDVPVTPQFGRVGERRKGGGRKVGYGCSLNTQVNAGACGRGPRSAHAVPIVQCSR